MADVRSGVGGGKPKFHYPARDDDIARLAPQRLKLTVPARPQGPDFPLEEIVPHDVRYAVGDPALGLEAIDVSVEVHPLAHGGGGTAGAAVHECPDRHRAEAAGNFH